MNPGHKRQLELGPLKPGLKYLHELAFCLTLRDGSNRPLWPEMSSFSSFPHWVFLRRISIFGLLSPLSYSTSSPLFPPATSAASPCQGSAVATKCLAPHSRWAWVSYGDAHASPPDAPFHHCSAGCCIARLRWHARALRPPARVRRGSRRVCLLVLRRGVWE